MVVSIIAVLALVGCVTAILMLATLPTASRLQGEITSLDTRLDAARSQVAALDAVGPSVDRLRHQVTGLSTRLTRLAQTVHGLQSSTSLTQNQAAGLQACLPQVQQELDGLTLKTSSAAGRLTRVGLAVPPLLSPSCQALFSGT